jgi:hypothetical protein
MRVSLPGLFKNAERALRSSKDDLACASAYSLGEMIDNLREVAEGRETIEEFFKLYVFDVKKVDKLADRVQAKNYDCMQEDEIDADYDASRDM